MIKMSILQNLENNPNIQLTGSRSGRYMPGDVWYTLTHKTPHLEVYKRIDADGTYHLKRMKNDKIIAEFEMKPTVRKFAQGFKGKLEKLGMFIAQDANGCERRGLRNIGELILKIAKRIR